MNLEIVLVVNLALPHSDHVRLLQRALGMVGLFLSDHARLLGRALGKVRLFLEYLEIETCVPV